MKKNFVIFTLILVLISACAIDPYTGETKVSNTAKGTFIGAAGGAAVGGIAKGKKGASYFCCVKCGHSIDADFNAALNIARSESIKNKEKRIFDDSFIEMDA